MGHNNHRQKDKKTINRVTLSRRRRNTKKPSGLYKKETTEDWAATYLLYIYMDILLFHQNPESKIFWVLVLYQEQQVTTKAGFLTFLNQENSPHNNLVQFCMPFKHFILHRSSLFIRGKSRS